jgi:hypothetical protein
MAGFHHILLLGSGYIFQQAEYDLGLNHSLYLQILPQMACITTGDFQCALYPQP